MDKASIFAAIADTPVKEPVPEWGGDVYLYSLTIGEWLAVAEVDQQERLFNVLEIALRDDKGNKLLTVADMKAMKGAQTKILVRLFNKVRELQGDIEELEKN